MKGEKAEGSMQKADKANALRLVCLLPTAFCLLFFRPCFSKVVLTSHLEPFIFHLRLVFFGVNEESDVCARTNRKRTRRLQNVAVECTPVAAACDAACGDGRGHHVLRSIICERDTHLCRNFRRHM